MPGPWGKAIERLRLAKRLTRETVAKRAKMMPTTYGKIEKGRHTQTRKLQDIADVFGVPIESVLLVPHLPAASPSGQTTAHPMGGSVQHGESAGVPIGAAAAADFRELQSQVSLLQQQLAEIAARDEARRRHRNGKRLPTTSARKSGRAQDARKPR